MKTLFLLVTLFFTTQLAAFDLQSGWDGEFRIAAFRPSSKLFREIYGEWETQYQVEAAKRFNECSNFYYWGNVSFLNENGHARGVPRRTRIMMAPISLGVKYMYPIQSCLKVYVGIGGTGNLVYIHDHTNILVRETKKFAWGGMIKSGIKYDFKDYAYLDLFVDYSYQKLSFDSRNRHNANVGGLMLGGGIGMNF